MNKTIRILCATAFALGSLHPADFGKVQASVDDGHQLYLPWLVKQEAIWSVRGTIRSTLTREPLPGVKIHVSACHQIPKGRVCTSRLSTTSDATGFYQFAEIEAEPLDSFLVEIVADVTDPYIPMYCASFHASGGPSRHVVDCEIDVAAQIRFKILDRNTKAPIGQIRAQYACLPHPSCFDQLQYVSNVDGIVESPFLAIGKPSEVTMFDTSPAQLYMGVSVNVTVAASTTHEVLMDLASAVHIQITTPAGVSLNYNIIPDCSSCLAQLLEQQPPVSGVVTHTAQFRSLPGPITVTIGAHSGPYTMTPYIWASTVVTGQVALLRLSCLTTAQTTMSCTP